MCANFFLYVPDNSDGHSVFLVCLHVLSLSKILCNCSIFDYYVTSSSKTDFNWYHYEVSDCKFVNLCSYSVPDRRGEVSSEKNCSW